MVNVHAKASQHSIRVLANDASVATNANLIGLLLNGAAHVYHLGSIARDCGREGSIRRDGGSCATSTALGASILTGISSSDLIQRYVRILIGNSFGKSSSRDVNTHIVDACALA